MWVQVQQLRWVTSLLHPQPHSARLGPYQCRTLSHAPLSAATRVRRRIEARVLIRLPIDISSPY